MRARPRRTQTTIDAATAAAIVPRRASRSTITAHTADPTGEENREAVDASHARELRDRQHRDLAVARSAQGNPSQTYWVPLGRDPHRRRATGPPNARPRSPQARDHHGKRRGKEREIRDQQECGDEASGFGSPPNVSCLDQPYKRGREVDRTGERPRRRQRRSARGEAAERISATTSGVKATHAKRGGEFRKAEREQRSREEG